MADEMSDPGSSYRRHLAKINEKPAGEWRPKNQVERRRYPGRTVERVFTFIVFMAMALTIEHLLGVIGRYRGY